MFKNPMTKELILEHAKNHPEGFNSLSLAAYAYWITKDKTWLKDHMIYLRGGDGSKSMRMYSLRDKPFFLRACVEAGLK